eukprot:759214-Hanusia_phi.AAC.4
MWGVGVAFQNPEPPPSQPLITPPPPKFTFQDPVLAFSTTPPPEFLHLDPWHALFSEQVAAESQGLRLVDAPCPPASPPSLPTSTSVRCWSIFVFLTALVLSKLHLSYPNPQSVLLLALFSSRETHSLSD